MRTLPLGGRANAELDPISAQLDKVNTKTVQGVAKAIKLVDASYKIEYEGYKRLVGLPRPAADRAVLAQTWAALRDAASDLRKVAKGLNHGDDSAVNKAVSAGDLAKATYKGLAVGFGFKVCGHSS